MVTIEMKINNDLNLVFSVNFSKLTNVICTRRLGTPSISRFSTALLVKRYC